MEPGCGAVVRSSAATAICGLRAEGVRSLIGGSVSSAFVWFARFRSGGIAPLLKPVASHNVTRLLDASVAASFLTRALPFDKVKAELTISRQLHKSEILWLALRVRGNRESTSQWFGASREAPTKPSALVPFEVWCQPTCADDHFHYPSFRACEVVAKWVIRRGRINDHDRSER